SAMGGGQPRSRGRRVSLRVKLGLALGGAAAVAVLVLTLLHAYRDVQDLRAQVNRENLRLATLIAQQVSDRVVDGINALTLFASPPAFVADTMAGDVDKVN